MTYQLTITTSNVATVEFETEDDARNWMDTWETQDYQSLNWEEHATEMVLTDSNEKLLRVAYCEMDLTKDT
jgi:uncharacterized protein (DUF1330 family)